MQGREGEGERGSMWDPRFKAGGWSGGRRSIGDPTFKAGGRRKREYVEP